MRLLNIAILTVMMFSGCSSPYKGLSDISKMDELEYPFATKKVQLPNNGHTIAYAETGKGDKTIIFIHGLGSYAPAWSRNIEELGKHYRCIAIDLPGYGKSSMEPHSGLMSYYASVIAEMINVLGLQNIYLAGHSMGGQIAITTALLFPDLVKGIILVSPAGFERFTAGQKQWLRDVTTPKSVKLTTAEAIQNNMAVNFYRMPKEAEFMITDRLRMRKASDFDAYCYAVAQSVKGMVDEPVIDYLDNIKIPTLILFGEKDNLIPNRYLNPGKTIDIAQYGASRIANSKLVMIPECGHFVMFEKPDVFNKSVIDFLK